MLTALSKTSVAIPGGERQTGEVMECAVKLTLTMQNKDGGWASFDRDCDEQFLTQIPFADHNAMIDPSTSDITGRGMETFSALGFSRENPAVQKALLFLEKEQERDGCWFGRWGCKD